MILKKRKFIYLSVGFLILFILTIHDLSLPKKLADRPNQPIEMSWRILSLLNSDTGEAPPIVNRLEGVTVKVAGFMIPLEDQLEQVSEFLLVPYEGACIHTPPPPPNQMIHVKMANGSVLYTWQSIWVKGVLSISRVKSPYGIVSYEIKGMDVRPFEGTEPKRSWWEFNI